MLAERGGWRRSPPRGRKRESSGRERRPREGGHGVSQRPLAGVALSPRRNVSLRERGPPAASSAGTHLGGKAGGRKEGASAAAAGSPERQLRLSGGGAGRLRRRERQGAVGAAGREREGGRWRREARAEGRERRPLVGRSHSPTYAGEGLFKKDAWVKTS